MSFFLSYLKKPEPDPDEIQESHLQGEPTVPLSPLPFSNEFFFELLKKAGAGSG
jgi:hypothetical protein